MSMFEKLRRRWRKTVVVGRYDGPRDLYDRMTADYPAEAPFGAQSAEWLAAKLSTFNAERLREAATIARGKTATELQDPQILREWLGGLWDAVSRELDCTQLSAAERDELRRIEALLAQSVHVLRPVVGY